MANIDPERKTFPSTHWSQVARAASPDTEAGRVALGDLLSRYRPALVGYAETQFGVTSDEGNDLFQSFVLNSVLRRDLVGRASRSKGYQFRSYVLRAWHTHIQEDHRARHRQKRYPSDGLTSLDGEAAPESLATVEPTPCLFDVMWARTVIAEALQRTRAECEAKGEPLAWAVFEARIVGPIWHDVPAVPYGALIEQLRLESPIHARRVLDAGKQAFRRCLAGVVGEYVCSDAAVATELRELHALLSQSPF